MISNFFRIATCYIKKKNKYSLLYQTSSGILIKKLITVYNINGKK